MKRSAFTLVELLVVLALILVISGISVAVFRNIGQVNADEAAVQLQTMLNAAKSRAMRDQRARGIRFYTDANGIASTAQYLDQEDGITGSASVTLTGSGQTVIVSGVDLTNSVQPLDYIIIFNRLPQQVTSLSQNADGTWTVNLASPLAYNITAPTGSFKFIPQPRVSGENVLSLPTNTGIDFGLMTTLGNSAPTDVMFSPSGSTVGGMFIVRDTTDLTIPWQQTTMNLIVVTPNGLVASVPVDPSAGFATPFSFASNP